MMRQPEWDSESIEEKQERRRKDAARALEGFVKKASEITKNRPRRPRPTLSVWDRIELRLDMTRRW